MSKRLTQDDKLHMIKTMCKSLSKEQVEHLEGIVNVDARYKCCQRYMREINEGKKVNVLKPWSITNSTERYLKGWTASTTNSGLMKRKSERSATC